MAKTLQEAYVDIYKANEYAHKLAKNELVDLLATTTGASKDDVSVASVIGTFIELKKYATFDVVDIPEDIGSDESEESSEEPKDEKSEKIKNSGVKFGISYTINLNLPATTEIKVFDAIFKSLKKNIIDEN